MSVHATVAGLGACLYIYIACISVVKCVCVLSGVKYDIYHLCSWHSLGPAPLTSAAPLPLCSRVLTSCAESTMVPVSRGKRRATAPQDELSPPPKK